MALDAEGGGVFFTIIGSSLCSVGAGGGLRVNLYFEIGTAVASFILSCILMFVAYQLLGPTYSVGFFGNQLSGQEWSVIGFMVGFVCLRKKFLGEYKIF